MKEIDFKDGNKFNNSIISNTPQSIVIPLEKLQNDGACPPNAIEIARIYQNAQIIEGLVIVVPKNLEKYTGGIIKHAWNVFNEIQFDVTEEKIWDKEDKTLLYFPIFKKNESEYGENIIDFDDQIYKYKKELEDDLEQAKKAKLLIDKDVKES